MRWKLFLDDTREPPDSWVREFIDSGVEYYIARSYDSAKQLCRFYGCPYFIAFDHDLGDPVHTGYSFANWLIEQDLDTDGRFLPEDFTFDVHSMNPVGAKKIRDLMESYLKHRST